MIRKITALFLFCLLIVSCMPFLGGNMIVRDNRFESDLGQHSLQMQQGTTVKQLYDAIKKAVKANPGEFEIKADDYSNQKATLWTFSNKYNQPVTFEAVQRVGQVYLSISVGEEGQARVNNDVIYYLQDLVLNNLQ
ncbi:hypothetical protein [Francisella tularensis]|uniref:hypothetical protein n=1 Tax=Francisella tularensis TaxID=263 RepID=UPI0002D4F9CF|nr:hypothetical protein [Francisella tularensis]